MDGTFTYQDQFKDLVKGLSNLRREGALCDVVLQTSDGQTFRVHRIVLSAASTYFKAMFCGGFKEADCNGKTPIVLHNVKAAGLKAVLDFVYSGVLLLNFDTVYDVLAAAHMFEMHVILHTCTSFLIDNMSTGNCLKSIQLSQSYLLPDVASAAEIFVVNHFLELSTQAEFLGLRKEELSRYLCDDSLVGEELSIYRAAKHWLDHDSGRLAHLVEIMTKIRFKSISATLLAHEVLQLDYIKYNKECFDMVMSAIVYHAHPYLQPLSGGFEQFRGEEKVVVIEDGELESKDGYATSTPNKLTFYSKSDIRFAIEQNIPGELNNHEETVDLMLIETSVNVVTVGNFMFVFGADSKTFSPVAKRFDGNSKSWTNLAPVPGNARVASTVTRVGDFIVVVGGMIVSKESRRVRDASKFVSSILCYSVRDNQWTEMRHYLSRVAYAAACVHADIMYVTGGNVPKNPYSQVESAFHTSSRLCTYHMERDIWLTKSEMKHARSEAIFEAVNDKLFVLGGCKYEADSAVRSVEMYDISRNQWSVVEQEPGFPYDSAAAYVDGDSIIILGGYDYEDDSASSRVTVFTSPKSGGYSLKAAEAQLKNITCQHACAVLKMTT